MSNLSHVAFFFFFSTKHNGNNRGFHERTINSQETLDNFFYLGQFGRRWALRDDCQAAVLLHRQAGEAAAESSTGMSNQKPPRTPFFFLSLNLRVWIEIFSLKAAASFQTVPPASVRPKNMNQHWEWNRGQHWRDVFMDTKWKSAAHWPQPAETQLLLLLLSSLLLHFNYWAERQIQPGVRHCWTQWTVSVFELGLKIIKRISQWSVYGWSYCSSIYFIKIKSYCMIMFCANTPASLKINSFSLSCSWPLVTLRTALTKLNQWVKMQKMWKRDRIFSDGGIPFALDPALMVRSGSVMAEPHFLSCKRTGNAP